MMLNHKPTWNRVTFYSMFISSLNSLDGTSYKGLFERNNIFLLTCTEGYLHYKHGFGMDLTEQELDLAHGFVYVCVYIYIYIR